MMSDTTDPIIAPYLKRLNQLRTQFADLLLEGAIVSFSDQTGQLSSVTQRALTNRITLVVEVSVQDRLKGKMLFTQSFVGFADYPVGNYIAQQEAIRFALSQITEEIFDRVVSGW